MDTAIDPICKMDVDTDNPAGGETEYQGQTYYICAPGCKVAFEKEPEAYLSDQPAEAADETPAEAPASKPSFLARLFGRK